MTRRKKRRTKTPQGQESFCLWNQSTPDLWSKHHIPCELKPQHPSKRCIQSGWHPKWVGACVTTLPLRFLPRGSSIPIFKDAELFQRSKTSFPHRGYGKNLQSFWDFGLPPYLQGMNKLPLRQVSSQSVLGYQLQRLVLSIQQPPSPKVPPVHWTNQVSQMKIFSLELDPPSPGRMSGPFQPSHESVLSWPPFLFCLDRLVGWSSLWKYVPLPAPISRGKIPFKRNI